MQLSFRVFLEVAAKESEREFFIELSVKVARVNESFIEANIRA
jgi:hypothetical protein